MRQSEILSSYQTIFMEGHVYRAVYVVGYFAYKRNRYYKFILFDALSIQTPDANV